MLNMLLDQVKQAIFNNPTTPHQPGNDPGNLVGTIEGLFNQHQQQYGGGGGNAEGTMQNPRPASEDPYGDPADQRGGGGGGLSQQFPGLRPASEDPYGDPADQR